MATFELKRGDTSPSIEAVLSPATTILTGATVVFNMWDAFGNLKVNRAAATISDNGDGTATGTPTVQYDWTTDDVDTVGIYYAEWEVTYSDGTIETFPHADDTVVSIMRDGG